MNYGTHENGNQGSPVSGREPDASPNRADRTTTLPSVTPNGIGEETTPARRGGGCRAAIHEFYERNLGLFLVFAAQTFGSVMNTAAKLLTDKDSPNPFHALHVIFVRMSATTVIGLLYMWYKKVPGFPFGPRNMVGLLIMRGISGFIGLFGLYYSLSYIEISDSTAINFLIPTWTAILCYVWMKESYRIQEALSGLLSLGGVLLIARPSFLFGPPNPVTQPIGDSTATTPGVDNSQRAFAIVCSILATFAAATAYTTIRVIGTRVHSLISVNYFAMLSTVGSFMIILIHPEFHFILPQGVEQWSLLLVIAVSGFLLQFLLTEGLQREKGGRATNMIYFQMVLALIIERVIWGTTPPPLSLVGSALIIGSAIWLSLQKPKTKPAAAVNEETGLLAEGRRAES
ncbi:hypothetical protein F4861DRAFT_522654 [Xylaria intraflava]|nr:hypothetical protein F4861DRAFT_522654 [Xylaria intraflava]